MKAGAEVHPPHPGPSRVVAVIPARYASTRLPAKPLADIHGHPMIEWVHARAKRAQGIDRVIVATDDERIAQAVREFGGEVVMTSADLASGTDRLAAVADRVPADVYVNVQGDEPLIDPAAIEAAARLVTSGRYSMGTVMAPMHDPADLANRAVVKVLADRGGRAIYFSRYAIPYSRGKAPELGGSFACRRHVGIYAYTRDTLFKFRSLAPSAMERGEMLEQLRALEEGIAIGISEIRSASPGVDTPEDLDKVRELLKGKTPATH